MLLTKWLWASESISDFVAGSPLARLDCLNKMMYKLNAYVQFAITFY